MSPTDHDDDEQHAGTGEVPEPVEERARPQERMVPQEAKSFRDPGANRRAVDLALLLERRAHGEQREDREGVRRGVGEERNGAAEPEERPAERRPREVDRRPARLLGAGGRRQLAPRHDRTQGPRRRGAEGDGSRPLDEGDDRDLPERDPVEQDRGDEASDRHDAHAVGRDHHVLAVPAIRRYARRQAEERVGNQPRETDEARSGRRVRHREHEPRVRHSTSPRNGSIDSHMRGRLAIRCVPTMAL